MFIEFQECNRASSVNIRSQIAALAPSSRKVLGHRGR